jgi:hypothetical protein
MKRIYIVMPQFNGANRSDVSSFSGFMASNHDKAIIKVGVKF